MEKLHLVEEAERANTADKEVQTDEEEGHGGVEEQGGKEASQGIKTESEGNSGRAEGDVFDEMVAWSPDIFKREAEEEETGGSSVEVVTPDEGDDVVEIKQEVIEID